MSSKNTSIAILGAGISGLAVAYYLIKSGLEVTVYEKENSAGGVIRTHRDSNWLVEDGPNTMLVGEQQIWDLIDDLNLTNNVIRPGNEAKKRFIARDGKLCAAPTSITDFFKTDLLSTSAKFRLLKEPFIPASKKKDESIAGFIRRRLGNEPLEYAVNPFVSGIYAGDPGELSVKHTFTSLFEMEQTHGSITKGFFKRDKNSKTRRALISFDEGLQSLPNALQSELSDAVRFNSTIEQISGDAVGWSVQLKSGEVKNHNTLISTIPAHQLPAIWSDAKSNQSIQQLSNIVYAPMSVLALGFRRNQITHPLDGFGMLIPEVEPFSLLGCLFSSSLFPKRAPDGHVLLTCFLGGARHRALAAIPTQDLTAETLPQLDQLLDVEGQPTFIHHRYWPKAIPQYAVGYDRFLETMKQIEDDNPGLYLAGNYRGGVSVPDCILNGFEMAEKVTQYL